MKFCIVGTGGVGGYFGARLAADGNDVTFIARGAHRAAMLEHGLSLRSPLGDAHIEQPVVVEDPSAAGLCDFILVCVKLWDTEAVAELIRPIVAQDSAVVSLQNGIRAEETLAGILGERCVLGGSAHISSHIAEPGVIEHIGEMARLTFGELDGLPSWRQECLVAACQSAGVKARVPDDIRKEIWRKFVHLSPFAGAACLFRAPLAALRDEPEKQATLKDLVAETLAIAKAEGIAFEDDYLETVLASYHKLPGEMRPSMLIDLEAGRRLELDWLTGEVARRGRAAAIATPASDRVVSALSELAQGRT